MIRPESRDRIVLLAIALLVLLGPVLILVLTLGALVYFGDLVLGRVTLVEFLELYIIELLLFTGFAYVIYRLTLWLVVHQTPVRSDVTEFRDDVGSPPDESETTEDR